MMALLEGLRDSGFSIWLREASTLWAYPFVLTMHTAGLAVLVGASAAVDLRCLGVASRIPLDEMRGFFTLMWLGFWVNAATGVMLFAGDAVKFGTSWNFALKLGLVAVGMIMVPFIHREVYGDGTAASVTPQAKVFAVISLLAWVAATTTGRLMAYVS